MDRRIKQLYDLFNGLPNNRPVVRQNQIGDAFTLLVLETLFKNYHNIVSLTQANLKEISSRIVPPPDEGIDIFFEQREPDENYYHVVQVKNSELSQHEIKQCLSLMRRTVATYLKNPKDV
ncbi:hypothetical protein MJD09_27920, partial [bacterium]|nr:hypothetical protein [bacterium]